MPSPSQTRLAIALLACSALACTATQPVRVLPKGQSRWISSIGGPLLPHHTPGGVIPYTNVGRMWGKSDNLTLAANAHLLAAAFGVAGVDVGAARRLRAASGPLPEITGQAQLYGFVGSGGARIYPNFTGTASWSAGEKTLLYGGNSATLKLNDGFEAFFSPLVGIQRDFGRKLVLQLEGKWVAANADMHSGLFEGENSLGGNGGLGLQFGVQVKR
ncbi:MAG: hypothetical protein P3A28_06510 [Gemmatimonadota bacterium]|nr:hypothetical protein [Gemmatimonadota bacterium]